MHSFDLGQHIKARRNALGLGQADVSLAAGVGIRFISKAYSTSYIKALQNRMWKISVLDNFV